MDKDAQLIYEAFAKNDDSDESVAEHEIKTKFLKFIQEYLGEAEHQDGMGYYDYFKNEPDPLCAVLEDMILARENGMQ